jgi:ferredoxin
MMKAKVDRDMCIGAAICISIAPAVFELDNEGKSRVVDQTAGDEEMLREAVDNCPAQAITLVDDDGNQVYP